MKFSSIAFAAAALIGEAAAYPAIAEAIANGEGTALEARQGVPDPTTRFNPKLQYVSTTGAHKFVMPDLTKDARGPCPGLNAMANHGYLPHNGVGTHADFVTGTFQAFGMAPDLSGFLTVLGGTIDGDGLVWSIGGPNVAVGNGLGLLGTPQGISGSHNKYESDVSPVRGDLYEYGNDFTVQMSQYQQLYNMAKANGDDIDLYLMNTFRSKRFDQSVANNPYFFNGPFTGILVAPAAFEFIYRFMSNKSAEHPAGKLNTAILNSFYGVKEMNGKLVQTPGSEARTFTAHPRVELTSVQRFPKNWYKRAIGDEYSIPYLNSDTVLAATRFPKFLTVGGNTGKVNTLTGVSPSDISGGVYNTKSLLRGNNLACFASQFATQTSPDLLKCDGFLTEALQKSAVGALQAQFQKSFGNLGCPKLTNPQTTQFNQFPGYKNLNCKTGQYN